VSKLNTHVTVHDSDGASHTFGPDDALPEWAESAITNPNVWAERPSASDAGPAGDAGKSEAKPKAKGKTAKAAPAKAGPAAPAPAVNTDGTGNDDDVLVAPPLAGAGSGAEAWRTYALAATARAGLNIEIPEGTKREDIVAALDEAGIATKSKE
jgi:hypothetical protein